jgi:hypothetical protein
MVREEKRVRMLCPRRLRRREICGCRIREIRKYLWNVAAWIIILRRGR